MDETGKKGIKLSLTGRRAYLPVVTGFVESASAAFGMQEADTLKLSLAAEEIFLHLSTAVCPEGILDIDCFNGLYYTRLAFSFSAPELNLKGLNIASSVNFDDPDDLNDMGLMIASRSVDHLNIAFGKGNRISLSVTKEKTYPMISEKVLRPEAARTLRMETADSEGVKQFALLAKQHAAASQFPYFFDYPGLLADMVKSGEYRLITARSPKLEIVGGILFRERTERVVEAFGPYALHEGDGKETAEALLEACINGIARTKALGLLIHSGLPAALEERFEPLGTLLDYGSNAARTGHSFFFRHLHEDPGFDVWSQGEFTDWLRQSYRRLVLARNIRNLRDMGETRTGFSLFSADLRRETAEATLRPLLPGTDFTANIERHIIFIRKEGFLNLFFELDLGIPWHAELIPALAANRFRPEIILPSAGQADLVIFQHHDADEP